MNKFIIRNDDVAFDTTIDEIMQFCDIADKYGHKIIQAITLIGETRKIKSAKLSNEDIIGISSRLFSENHEVLNYLLSRDDFIGVHGLWHTHKPSIEEVRAAKYILEGLGFKPTYFVPPFNEGEYPQDIAGLKLCNLSEDKERLESYLDEGNPDYPIMYLHSWRFDNKWYTFDKLDKCLNRLENQKVLKLNLGSKHRKLEGFENLDKIFGWTFQQGLPQYENDSVDGITISHALMFLTDQELEKFTKEMWRVLKPGGVVRITEDDTENSLSNWYKTGNVSSGPSCLTGPIMMRNFLEKAGFEVYDADRETTKFTDKSLMQAYRGGPPNVFFIEGVKV